MSIIQLCKKIKSKKFNLSLCDVTLKTYEKIGINTIKTAVEHHHQDGFHANLWVSCNFAIYGWLPVPILSSL